MRTPKSEENLQTLANQILLQRFAPAKEGILVLDATNGNIVEINPYLIKMSGYPKDELVEKAIWEVGFFKISSTIKINFLNYSKRNLFNTKTCAGRNCRWTQN